MADILSQEEVDSLLSAVSEGQVPLAGAAESGKRVMLYDFRRPARVSRDQLHNLEMLYETFARELSTLLSGALRVMPDISVASVDEISFGEFIMSLENPTFIALFEMKPLQGSALLEISPVLEFAIIDRLLGGSGEAAQMSRGLTAIEQGVLGRLANKVLLLLKASWSGLVAGEPRLLRMESNPQFCRILPEHEMTVTAAFNIQLGEASGVMSVCLPDMMIQPLLEKLSGRQWSASDSEEQAETAAPAVMRHIKRSALPCTAVLGQTRLSVGELMRMGAGDILRLDTGADGDVVMEVGGIPKFMGKPGLAGRQRAVQLTTPISDEE